MSNEIGFVITGFIAVFLGAATVETIYIGLKYGFRDAIAFWIYFVSLGRIK